MKKRLLLLLLIATIAFCLCACGSYEERMAPISTDDESDYEDEEYEDEYEIPDEPSNVLDIDTVPLVEIKEDPVLLEIWCDKHDYWDAFIWEDVESSAILEAGYSPLWEDMAIVFHTSPDSTYVYYDVPEEVFYEMIESDSVGGYYNAYVKGQYESECL